MWERKQRVGATSCPFQWQKWAGGIEPSLETQRNNIKNDGNEGRMINNAEDQDGSRTYKNTVQNHLLLFMALKFRYLIMNYF